MCRTITFAISGKTQPWKIIVFEEIAAAQTAVRMAFV